MMIEPLMLRNGSMNGHMMTRWNPKCGNSEDCFALDPEGEESEW